MTRDRLFFIVFGAANLGLFLYGLLALTMPSYLLETFSLRVYQFPAYAESAVGYLLALYRLLGLLNLLLGASGLFLLWRLWVNPQPWLIPFIILLSLFAYLGPIVFDNTVGDIGIFEMIEHVLFTAMLVVVLFRLREGYAS